MAPAVPGKAAPAGLIIAAASITAASAAANITPIDGLPLVGPILLVIAPRSPCWEPLHQEAEIDLVRLSDHPEALSVRVADKVAGAGEGRLHRVVAGSAGGEGCAVAAGSDGHGSVHDDAGVARAPDLYPDRAAGAGRQDRALEGVGSADPEIGADLIERDHRVNREYPRRPGTGSEAQRRVALESRPEVDAPVRG